MAHRPGIAGFAGPNGAAKSGEPLGFGQHPKLGQPPGHGKPRPGYSSCIACCERSAADWLHAMNLMRNLLQKKHVKNTENVGSQKCRCKIPNFSSPSVTFDTSVFFVETPVLQLVRGG